MCDSLFYSFTKAFLAIVFTFIFVIIFRAPDFSILKYSFSSLSFFSQLLICLLMIAFASPIIFASFYFKVHIFFHFFFSIAKFLPVHMSMDWHNCGIYNRDHYLSCVEIKWSLRSPVLPVEHKTFTFESAPSSLKAFLLNFKRFVFIVVGYTIFFVNLLFLHIFRNFILVLILFLQNYFFKVLSIGFYVCALSLFAV
jgi:hypothetical protein